MNSLPRPCQLMDWAKGRLEKSPWPILLPTMLLSLLREKKKNSSGTSFFPLLLLETEGLCQNGILLCVFICVWLWVCAPQCTRVDIRGEPWASALTFPLETSLLFATATLAYLTCYLPGILPSQFPISPLQEPWDYEHALSIYPVLHGFRGFGLRRSSSGSKCFTVCIIFPAITFLVLWFRWW